MKVKIRLETLSDVHRFVKIATAHSGDIHITDGNDLRVSAKSLLGTIYAMEFDNIWCESEEDIYHAIEKFIIV